MSAWDWTAYAFVGALFVGALFGIAEQEMRKPVSLGYALRRTWVGGLYMVLVLALMAGTLHGLKRWVLDPRTAVMAAEADFEAGLARALEDTARLSRVPAPPTLRETRGERPAGGAYAYLADEAGAVVRVADLGRDACLAAMDGLSPYARTVLAVAPASGPTLPVSEGLCPPEGGVLNANIRAR